MRYAQDIMLLLKNPALHPGLNLEVTHTDAHHREFVPGQVLRLHDHSEKGQFPVIGFARLVGTQLTSWEDITSWLLKFHHDPALQTIEAFGEWMGREYGNGFVKEDLTLVWFWHGLGVSG